MQEVIRVAANARLWLAAALLLVAVAKSASAAESYHGKYIGKLKQLHHGLGGEVYAVDARTLHIRDFQYDGEGPAAYFYVSNSKTPGANGIRINDEKGTQNVLRRYRKEHITLTLPEGKTLNNIKWFYVWCDEFAVNFGDVKITKGLGFPKPLKLESLSGIHGVSSDPVVIVDAQTFLVPNFSYDGEAPDAKFWVGTGSKPTSTGLKLPDENGKVVPLRRYDRKTIVLTLPGDMTVFDIGHFGVWCEAFAVDFGHVKIPKGANVPPSLKMLGVSPQKRPRSLQLSLDQSRTQLLEPTATHQQQQYFGANGQEYKVTTYKPSHLARNIERSDNFQIVPSISLPSSQLFGQNSQQYQPQQYQSQQYQSQQYQPQQTQQTNFFARRNDQQSPPQQLNGDAFRNNLQVQNYYQQQQQQQRQPAYQQAQARDDFRYRQDPKSFSRLSFNGQSDSFVRYN